MPRSVCMLSARVGRETPCWFNCGTFCKRRIAGIKRPSSFPSVSFDLPLSDNGSGAVNTSLLNGAGSATFTRATVAWTRLSSGLWAEVASGTARSYYLPDLTYGGYLAEGARTNLCLHSNDFTNAAWTKSNMTAAKTATGPDGVANSASTLTATAGNATALQAITSASASRISSVFIKRRTGSGTINITQDNGTTWTAATVTSGWTQVSSTNQTLTNPTVGIRIVTSGDEVDVWCFMNEVAAFASTPIPTAGATVTRNADVLTYPTAGNLLGATGAAYAEVASYFTAAAWPNSLHGFIGSNNTNGNPMMAGTTTLFLYDGANRALGTMAPSTTVRKVATSWGGSSCSGALSGALGATSPASFDGDMNVATPIDIGCLGTGFQLFGTIKNVRIWKEKLTNDQIIELTE